MPLSNKKKVFVAHKHVHRSHHMFRLHGHRQYNRNRHTARAQFRNPISTATLPALPTLAANDHIRAQRRRTRFAPPPRIGVLIYSLSGVYYTMRQ